MVQHCTVRVGSCAGEFSLNSLDDDRLKQETSLERRRRQTRDESVDRRVCVCCLFTRRRAKAQGNNQSIGRLSIGRSVRPSVGRSVHPVAVLCNGTRETARRERVRERREWDVALSTMTCHSRSRDTQTLGHHTSTRETVPRSSSSVALTAASAERVRSGIRFSGGGAQKIPVLRLVFGAS